MIIDISMHAFYFMQVASSNSAQLTLKEMEGMWIVVSVLVGIALTMVALTKINK